VQGGAQSQNTTATNGGNTIQGGNVTITQEAARPAASAPANSLTAVGTDNCLGSASGSFGNGFFAIGGGKTTESVECNRRAYARMLAQLGLQPAALALLCLNDEVRASMKASEKDTGLVCPQDAAERKAAAALAPEVKEVVAAPVAPQPVAVQVEATAVREPDVQVKDLDIYQGR
jgi:hypothetical protein